MQTFQTYRQVCTGGAFGKMRQSQEGPTVAQRLAQSGWAHGNCGQWWLDLVIQLGLYSTLDVVPLVLALPSLLRLDLVGFLSALLATACSAAVAHVTILYVVWTASDVAAKAVAWKEIRGSDISSSLDVGEALAEEPQAEEAPESEDPLKPAHFCAVFGGILHLGWVMILKAVVFVAIVIFAIQKDVADENPFWLVAALLIGVAFWHSVFAQGLKLAAGCLHVFWARASCLQCRGADAESETPGGEVRFPLVPERLLAQLQAWGATHAGLSATSLSRQYELAVYALLLQLALFGNFRWVGGAIFILLLILILLLRRATLVSLGHWCAFVSIIESAVFVILAVAINAAYSAAAGAGVLVMATLLQFTLARQELRAWRTWRAVTLGLHCSLVVVVALCMWSMQGGTGWKPPELSKQAGQKQQATRTYPFCDLRWPLGEGTGQSMSLIEFADMCALTNLPSSDFNNSLKSQFPGWTLVFERRAGETQSDKTHGYYDWTTFFELADPRNETTLFAVRGTQSPLEVLQDVNIFTPVAVTQIAAYFGPDLTSSVTKTVFLLFAGLPTIDKDFFQARVVAWETIG